MKHFTNIQIAEYELSRRLEIVYEKLSNISKCFGKVTCLYYIIPLSLGNCYLIEVCDSLSQVVHITVAFLDRILSSRVLNTAIMGCFSGTCFKKET